ncbi:MAG TPA: DUF6265 family protein [Chitinophagaceae bacterium]|nr:DUF6265 family protein [Chitinophagaceae bacterium]
MKKVLFIAAVFVSIAMLHSELSAQQVNEDFKKLDWLEGTWIRTNVKPGREAHEKWQRVSSTEWLGWGISMKGNDTAFVEKLKLVIKDDNIYYVADIVENKEPVYFKFTTITDHGFVCENPQHDFPKTINYQKNGNGIKATISGDGKSIDYLFEKQ